MGEQSKEHGVASLEACHVIAVFYRVIPGPRSNWRCESDEAQEDVGKEGKITIGQLRLFRESTEFALCNAALAE